MLPPVRVSCRRSFGNVPCPVYWPTHSSSWPINRRRRLNRVFSPRKPWPPCLGIELSAENKLVGGTGFASITNGTGVFGFVLHRDHWGAGIATEASRALLRFGFETL